MPFARAVFLDVGGVLVGHDNALLFERLASRCRPATSAQAIEALALASGLRVGRPMAEFHHALQTRFDYGDEQSELLAAWSSHFSRIAASQDRLASLEKAYRLFVLSNTNAAHWQAIQAHYLDASFFERLFVSHELGLSKPDWRIFARALEHTGLRAMECVFVDDDPINVAAATSLGFKATLYDTSRDLEAIVVEAAAR